MKSRRVILFRAGAVLLLLIIAAIMFIIGRGHTVYFDNKEMEYNGVTYEMPYKVGIYQDDEQISKLYEKERGMVTCIGQSLGVTLKVMQEKDGSEEEALHKFDIPYSFDGVVINLPAYLAGLPEEVYMTEFVQEVPEEEEEEVPVIDEFAIPELGEEVVE